MLMLNYILYVYSALYTDNLSRDLPDIKQSGLPNTGKSLIGYPAENSGKIPKKIMDKSIFSFVVKNAEL